MATVVDGPPYTLKRSVLYALLIDDAGASQLLVCGEVIFVQKSQTSYFWTFIPPLSSVSLYLISIKILLLVHHQHSQYTVFNALLTRSRGGGLAVYEMTSSRIYKILESNELQIFIHMVAII